MNTRVDARPGDANPGGHLGRDGDPPVPATRGVSVVFVLGLALVGFISFGLFATSVFGAAAETLESPTELTLAEAIQRAFVRAPSLTLARFDVEEAAIGLQEAELGQLVGNPRRELEEARHDLKESQEAYRDELVRIALQVEEAYYKVLRAADGLEIQQSTVEQAQRQFALTQARYEAGLIARQDYLEAELRRDETVAGLETARRQVTDARRQLYRLTGLDDDGAVVLRDEFPFAPFHIELAEAVAEALARRPEMERARRAVERARAKVDQAGVIFAAPVELRRAEMDLMRSEIRLEQALHDIESEVRTGWHGLMDLERGVAAAARREELALARVEISRTRYDAGTLSLLQLLQDEEAYAKARQDAAAAVWDYNLARARFLRTLGRAELPPLPETVATYIESWQRDP